MTNWYKEIKEDATKVNDALEYYNNEYLEAKKELKDNGKHLQQVQLELPSLFEIRYSQLQELEAIIEFFDIKVKGLRSNLYQKLLNNSQRALSSNDVKQYIDGDKNIMDLQLIINDRALVRNKFISITKALDVKNWQLSNVTKSLCAGLNDVIL